MSSRSTSSGSQTDWDRLRSMKDEDVDLSELPEITAHDLRGAVLRVGGKPVPEGKSFVGMLLDSDLVEELRKRAGEKGLQRLIDETLRDSVAKV
jgi:uncharacterized protein (DUF4415 family)